MLRALASFLVLISASATAGPASAPCDESCQQTAMLASIDAAKAGQYMAASFGLLDHLGVGQPAQIADPDIFDQWSQVWSAMNNTPFPNAQKEVYTRIKPEELARLRSAEARPAIAEIVARAQRTRVVFLDEDHLSPRDRLFGLQVAQALRPLGYSVLAVETLKRDRDDAESRGKMDQLSRDGYLRRSSGYYTNDPVFADFLRQALRLGYRLVSYESAGFTDEADGDKRSARREQEQAENVVRRALANPQAKVLIYGGRHHAAKAPIDDPNASEHLWMAERLKRLTGIDPLVIDQVELGETPADRPSSNLYGIVRHLAPKQSMVLTVEGQPLVIGLLAGAADLQVVHPAAGTRHDRPDWLADMGRAPSPIPASLVSRRGMRLVQAFLANEAADAIPIDQVLVTAGRTMPSLMLPAAPVRYAVQDRP